MRERKVLIHENSVLPVQFFSKSVLRNSRKKLISTQRKPTEMMYEFI